MLGSSCLDVMIIFVRKGIYEVVWEKPNWKHHIIRWIISVAVAMIILFVLRL